MAQADSSKQTNSTQRRRRGNPRPRRLDVRVSVRFDNFDRICEVARLTKTTPTEVIRIGTLKEVELRIRNARRTG